jgi:hypothetical protein
VSLGQVPVRSSLESIAPMASCDYQCGNEAAGQWCSFEDGDCAHVLTDKRSSLAKFMSGESLGT